MDNRRRFAPLLLISLIFLAVFLTFSPALPAAAQTGGQVVLAGVNANSFPGVTFFLRAAEENGAFLLGLQSGDLQVVENGLTLPVDSLEEFEPGVQTILMLNLSDAFSKRIEEQTIFEHIASAWGQWLRTLPEGGPDEYSIGSNTGLQVIREKSPVVTADGLERFTPDLQNSRLNMLGLAQALDLAVESMPSPYAQRVIFYVTSLPTSSADSAIENLTRRAVDQDTHVFVWLVGQANSASTPTGQLLAELAFSTGGQLFTFSGTESLPDIETYLAPLRTLYRGTYTSTSRTSGDHSVSLIINHGEQQLKTSPASYNLLLEAPNPMFLVPPSRIERTWQQGSAGSRLQLQPEQVSIRMLLEFRDRLQRPLKVSRLLVDGEVMVENTAEPFDVFDWPLDQYETSGKHRLQIQIEDSLGLSQTSSEHQVEVLVAAPIRGAAGWITRERVIIAIALLASLLVLTWVIVRTGRKQWRPLRLARKVNDPLSQPVKVRPGSARRIMAEPQITIPRAGVVINVPAYLVHIDEEGIANPSETVPLSRSEVTIGSNPHQALYILQDSAVDALHARLTHDPAGNYILADAGSTAGTWVNYQEVGGSGTILKHGDRIHIGRSVFRFEVRQGGVLPTPVITPYREE